MGRIHTARQDKRSTQMENERKKKILSPKHANIAMTKNVHMRQPKYLASMGLSWQSEAQTFFCHRFSLCCSPAVKLSAKFYVTTDLAEAKFLPRTSKSFLFIMIAVILEILIALLFPPAAVAMVCSFLRLLSIQDFVLVKLTICSMALCRSPAVDLICVSTVSFH